MSFSDARVLGSDLRAPFDRSTLPEPAAAGSRVDREYWDERARLFAGQGPGLAAVASYGMPELYNRSIDFLQWLALRPWLAAARGLTVLDVGCGIGRWSLRLARSGARVIGVDPSTAMLSEARRRTRDSGLEDHCRFFAGDVTELRLGGRFQLILAVTVLQHVVEPRAFERALHNLKNLLEPKGRLVLLEVAPGRADDRCDATRFRSRSFSFYAECLREAGLRVTATRGVDPCLLRYRLLPYYRSWPPFIATPSMLLATALTTPVDALLASRLTSRSWHKVMVVAHDV